MHIKILEIRDTSKNAKNGLFWPVLCASREPVESAHEGKKTLEVFTNSFIP